MLRKPLNAKPLFARDPTLVSTVKKQFNAAYIPSHVRVQQSHQVIVTNPVSTLPPAGDKAQRIREAVSARSALQPGISLSRREIKTPAAIPNKQNPEAFKPEPDLNKSVRAMNGTLQRGVETLGFDRGIFSTEDRLFKATTNRIKSQRFLAMETRVLSNRKAEDEVAAKVHQANLARIREQRDRYEKALIAEEKELLEGM